MKITISGWPGAGSTTLALVLSKTLNLKYVSGSAVFRYLGSKLKFADTGEDRIIADKYLEEHFGKIFDRFLEKLLTDSTFDNILIESDITSFNLGKDYPFFSVFLTTAYEERLKRLGVDGRDKDIDFLKARDQKNAEFYKKLHGINWFNIIEIQAKHDLVIDNSHISVAEEMNLIYNELLKNAFINEAKFNELVSKSEEEDRNYWKNGKDFVREDLKSKSLFMNEKEILSLIIKNFKTQIELLPDDIKTAVLD